MAGLSPWAAKLPTLTLPISPSSAKLLGSPFALLRFRAEEGLLNPDLDPVTGEGEKVGIWVNLKSRTKWRSLYPLAGDKFAEYLPVRMVLPRQDVPALKKETVAVAFNNRIGHSHRSLTAEVGIHDLLRRKIRSGIGGANLPRAEQWERSFGKPSHRLQWKCDRIDSDVFEPRRVDLECTVGRGWSGCDRVWLWS